QRREDRRTGSGYVRAAPTHACEGARRQLDAWQRPRGRQPLPCERRRLPPGRPRDRGHGRPGQGRGVPEGHHAVRHQGDLAVGPARARPRPEIDLRARTALTLAYTDPANKGATKWQRSSTTRTPTS